MPLAFEVLERGFRLQFADALRATHARRLFIAYLSGQVAPECDLFNVELVFGEILGNVARHAPGPVAIEVIWEDLGARLEVWDQGPGYEPYITSPGTLEESHRGLFLVSEFSREFRVERRDGRTVTSVMLPIERAITTSFDSFDEVCMSDIPSGQSTPAAPVSIEEIPPEVVAAREARLRAVAARTEAERALREAEAAEAQLVAREAEVLAAAAAARRERLEEQARAATALEREALEALSALQFQIRPIASIKSQAEAAVAAIRASLEEHEEQLRAAEAKARKLQEDITAAEGNAQECARARERAAAALHAALQYTPFSTDAAAPTVTIEAPQAGSAAQRAAERRAADAARAERD
jgi:anti-sigma regulatory factor (Ser/Thr protein kinase)